MKFKLMYQDRNFMGYGGGVVGKDTWRKKSGV
jgi:hypothetical protein